MSGAGAALARPGSGHPPPWPDRAAALAEFNARLDREARPGRLNETCLEAWLAELEALAVPEDRAFWLTLARSTEMALWCAGNYADQGEFQAAGDLLVNPRLVLVHVQGRPRPVVKWRHGRLTEQFRAVASDRARVVDWLIRQTLVEVRREPLLPHLYARLRGSGWMSRPYLDGLAERMERVAEALGFLGSLRRPEGLSVSEWLRGLPESERDFITGRLCRFTLDTFMDLGRKLEQALG